MMSVSFYADYQQLQWLWHGCRWEYFAFTGGINRIFLVILKQLNITITSSDSKNLSMGLDLR
jgi:hypothetical protein